MIVLYGRLSVAVFPDIFYLIAVVEFSKILKGLHIKYVIGSPKGTSLPVIRNDEF